MAASDRDGRALLLVPRQLSHPASSLPATAHRSASSRREKRSLPVLDIGDGQRPGIARSLRRRHRADRCGAVLRHDSVCLCWCRLGGPHDYRNVLLRHVYL